MAAPPRRVLIGCEESGASRRAYTARGHDAWSCDIQPSRDGSPKHLQMDVIDAITQHGPWDIIILHPPCTAMCVSGNSTYGTGMPKNQVRQAAIHWTRALWDHACRHARIGCALENPVSVVFKYLRGELQYVQPWMFGHPEQKKTGLMRYNLPELKPTNNVEAAMLALPKKLRQRIHYMSPGANRARDRSETFQGIAEAFADQWV